MHLLNAENVYDTLLSVFDTTVSLGLEMKLFSFLQHFEGDHVQ